MLNALTKVLFNEKYKECLDDPTRQCTYGYTFDRNCALRVYGNIHECCRVKKQIKAAANLANNRAQLHAPPKDGE